MLAGALFNRATDIFTTVVDLESKGVHISFENELMKECSECLQEAMELGKSVRHFSGLEGIDELWGEPLKAFTMSARDFYYSRYIKISMTMGDIDEIQTTLRNTLRAYDEFSCIWPILDGFSELAKNNCETMKIDRDYFSIWPKFVTLSDQIIEMAKSVARSESAVANRRVLEGCELVRWGHDLITYISGARVPMPDTTARFLEQCREFKQKE